ncbi:hypothetical protein E2C01_068659 [Portunus trituberculatus]|uniref:Uncharacterized protein n=1 Tax=Portunus trituberculatus TaxID=210409 RepID=A0A5B7HSK4_PORTR|nr:hypothetical protein [Portunus trituberculatus]
MLAAVVAAILVAWLVAAWLLVSLLPRTAAGHHAIKKAGVARPGEAASPASPASAEGKSGSPAEDRARLRHRGPTVSASPATPPSPTNPLPPAATPSPPSSPAPAASSAGWADKRLTADTRQSRSGAVDGAIWLAGSPVTAPGGEVRRRLLDRRKRLIARLYDPTEDAAHVLSLYFRPPSRPASRPASRHVSRERDSSTTPRRRSAPPTPAPSSPLPMPAKAGRGIFGDGVAGAGRGCGGPDTHSDDSGISVEDQHQQVCIEIGGLTPACPCP